MARSRNIKPGFFKNEDLAECTPWARLCFAGLWTLADREGLLEDRPKRIKGELFAFDSVEVEPLLVELASRGFIVRYQVDGQALIAIPAFHKHQNPHHREQPSELPPPPSLGLDPDGMNQKPEASVSMAPKPEALPPLHGGQAVLIPSSLIPSTLIPDSMAAPDGAQGQPSIKNQVWALGKQLLKAGGQSNPGPLIGKLIDQHGEEKTLAALRKVEADKPSQVVPYLMACVGGKQPSRVRQVAGAAEFSEELEGL